MGLAIVYLGMVASVIFAHFVWSPLNTLDGKRGHGQIHWLCLILLSAFSWFSLIGFAVSVFYMKRKMRPA